MIRESLWLIIGNNIFTHFSQIYGAMAERSGRGLQHLPERFDSAWHLQEKNKIPDFGDFLVTCCFEISTRICLNHTWESSIGISLTSHVFFPSICPTISCSILSLGKPVPTFFSDPESVFLRYPTSRTSMHMIWNSTLFSTFYFESKRFTKSTISRLLMSTSCKTKYHKSSSSDSTNHLRNTYRKSHNF